MSSSGFQMFRSGAANRQNGLEPQKDPHTHEFHHEKKCAEKLRKHPVNTTHLPALSSLTNICFCGTGSVTFLSSHRAPFYLMSILLFMLLDKASCIPGWSLIHHEAENNLDHLSLLHPSPWDYSQSPPYLVCVMLWTQLSV